MLLRSCRTYITCMVALCAITSSTVLVLFAGIAAACGGTGGGGGCPAPSVSTGGADSITSNSATLTGSVNPQGCYTEYAFEYGRSSEGYPNEIGSSAGSGTSPVFVQTYSALGLQPSTSYHYRLSAWNSSGETTGGSGSFTTKAACTKPTVTMNNASSITDTSAVLSGSVNPNGCQTTSRIEWGPSSSPTSYPNSVSGPSGTLNFNVSHTASGLQPNTGYHYRISANNEKGTTLGSDTTFTTRPPTSGHDPILFVHGWNGSADTWDTYFKWFIRDGWWGSDLETWTYESSQSNVSTAYEISAHVDQMLRWTGAKKVDIITHSMGGLSSRYYLKFLNGSAKVDDWVSLAGPNHGSQWANGIYGVTCFSSACEQMRVGSSFLQQLNYGDETPGIVNYGTWRVSEIICDELVIPSDSVKLIGAYNVFSPICVSHSGMHENEFIYKEVREFVR
jgi:triacylglycerol lipase